MTKRPIIRLSECLAGLYLIMVSGMAMAEETETKFFLLTDLSGIQFKVPKSWTANVHGRLHEQPPMVEFEPRSGANFNISTILATDDQLSVIKMTPKEMRKAVQATAAKLYGRVIEEDIEVKALATTSGTGYYFTASARQADENGFTRITYGIAAIGDALVPVTALSGEHSEKSISNALAMVSSAVYIDRATVLHKNTAERNRQIAYKLEVGEGTNSDMEAAIQFYMIAAEQGDPESQYRLALLYSGQDSPFGDKEELRLCTLAGNKGHGDALDQLGVIYARGKSSPTNMILAVKYTTAAATQGVSEAMFRLGSYYSRGTGVPVDKDQAMKWIKKAADAGNVRGICELGCAYMNGKIVPRDVDEAEYQWYKAALAGSKFAYDILYEELDCHGTFADSDWRSLKRKAILEIVPDALAINIGDSTNTVISILGQTFSRRNSTQLVDSQTQTVSYKWTGDNSSITIRDGKVYQTDNLRLTDIGRKKLAASGKLYDLHAYPFLSPNDPKYWALATGALLTELNGKRHDLLASFMPTLEEKRSELRSLYRWWNVTSRESFLEKLDWIEKGGHRKGFDEISRIISQLSPAELVQAIDTHRDIAIVARYQKEVGKKGILGWDYGRYVCLCRWGYGVGYLTENEAWARIMPAAKMLQANFNSWAELGKNYLIGREYWSKVETSKKGAAIQEAYDTLLSNPRSPWKQCPWNMKLDGSATSPSHKVGSQTLPLNKRSADQDHPPAHLPPGKSSSAK